MNTTVPQSVAKESFPPLYATAELIMPSENRENSGSPAIPKLRICIRPPPSLVNDSNNNNSRRKKNKRKLSVHQLPFKHHSQYTASNIVSSDYTLNCSNHLSFSSNLVVDTGEPPPTTESAYHLSNVTPSSQCTSYAPHSPFSSNNTSKSIGSVASSYCADVVTVAPCRGRRRRLSNRGRKTKCLSRSIVTDFDEDHDNGSIDWDADSSDEEWCLMSKGKRRDRRHQWLGEVNHGQCAKVDQESSVVSLSDLDSPDSVLARMDLKRLINRTTFDSLPPINRYHLSQLLPECDRWLEADGVARLHPTALTNPFLTSALQDYPKRLASGEFLSLGQRATTTRAGLRASTHQQRRPVVSPLLGRLEQEYQLTSQTFQQDNCWKDDIEAANGVSISPFSVLPDTSRVKIPIPFSETTSKLPSTRGRKKKKFNTVIRITKKKTKDSICPASVSKSQRGSLKKTNSITRLWSSQRKSRLRECHVKSESDDEEETDYCDDDDDVDIIKLEDTSTTIGPLSSPQRRTDAQIAMSLVRRRGSSSGSGVGGGVHSGVYHEDVCPLSATSSTTTAKSEQLSPGGASSSSSTSVVAGVGGVASPLAPSSSAVSIGDDRGYVMPSPLISHLEKSGRFVSPGVTSMLKSVSSTASPPPCRTNPDSPLYSGSVTPSFGMPPPRQTKTLASMREKMRAKRELIQYEKRVGDTPRPDSGGFCDFIPFLPPMAFSTPVSSIPSPSFNKLSPHHVPTSNTIVSTATSFKSSPNHKSSISYTSSIETQQDSGIESNGFYRDNIFSLFSDSVSNVEEKNLPPSAVSLSPSCSQAHKPSSLPCPSSEFVDQSTDSAFDMSVSLKTDSIDELDDKKIDVIISSSLGNVVLTSLPPSNSTASIECHSSSFKCLSASNANTACYSPPYTVDHQLVASSSDFYCHTKDSTVTTMPRSISQSSIFDILQRHITSSSSPSMDAADSLGTDPSGEVRLSEKRVTDTVSTSNPSTSPKFASSHMCSTTHQELIVPSDLEQSAT